MWVNSLCSSSIFFHTMTSQWPRWRLKSPAWRLFTRLLRRRSNKTSKHRVTGLCAGNSPVTGDRWIPRTKGQYRGKCFNLMTSWCDLRICFYFFCCVSRSFSVKNSPLIEAHAVCLHCTTIYPRSSEKTTIWPKYVLFLYSYAASDISKEVIMRTHTTLTHQSKKFP